MPRSPSPVFSWPRTLLPSPIQRSRSAVLPSALTRGTEARGSSHLRLTGLALRLQQLFEPLPIGFQLFLGLAGQEGSGYLKEPARFHLERA